MHLQRKAVGVLLCDQPLLYITRGTEDVKERKGGTVVHCRPPHRIEIHLSIRPPAIVQPTFLDCSLFVRFKVIVFRLFSVSFFYLHLYKQIFLRFDRFGTNLRVLSYTLFV
jgi:hypothetical protein